ncbi:hypothetical protein AmDm5_0572 [Acetobacter malorum]|nr:hypothetical protein AmDm5_0572 [Acetobacter malorum]
MMKEEYRSVSAGSHFMATDEKLAIKYGFTAGVYAEKDSLNSVIFHPSMLLLK